MLLPAEIPTAEIPLTEPPEPVALGVGIHGMSQNSDAYRLPTLWCLHLYTYRGEVTLGGRTFPLRPGYAGITPAGEPVLYRYEGRSQHLYAHFRCRPSPAPPSSVPLMQDLGERFPAIYAALEEVALQPQLSTARKTARLWDVLCQLAEPSGEGGIPTGLHPAVRACVGRIERELSEPIRVETLAHDANISYGYLSRLFQKELGTSVIGYLGRRRMEKARLLLAESTLPVNAVARAVGIPDLHQFNKAFRRAFGKSPRALRAEVLLEERK